MRRRSNAASIGARAATAVALFVLATGCVVSTGPEGQATETDAAVTVDGGPGCQKHATLEVMGVTCPSCREVVVAALMNVHGVVSAQVSLSPPEADVVYCDTLQPSALVQAVDGAGYRARLKN